MYLLQAEGVCKNFGGLAAVSMVDFQVTQGEIVGLIGPNGAGKTTFFNLLSGALVPGSGLIRFKERKINGLKPHQICKMGIARTFQAVKIFPNMTVLQNVLPGAIFGTSQRLNSAAATEQAEKCLEFVGMAHLAHNPVKDINLVNQKRIEVARALATQPELMLLDEMMAGLTPTEIEEAIKLVERIRAKGITVVMIEHVMKAIMSVCERIAVLHHGEKIAEGTPQEISTDKTVIEVYLGEC